MQEAGCALKGFIYIYPPHPPPGIAGAPRGEAATVAYNFHHPADMKVLVPQVVGSHVWAHIL